MRVVTWNMGLSPPRRLKLGAHDQAWHYLLGLGPDLAFVQEGLPPSWVRGEGALVHGPFKEWGSAIFSPRFPLQVFHPPEDSRLRSLGAYLALGSAVLPDGSDAFVSSVHAVAREASPAQLGDLDPVPLTRPSVGHPMVNDLVFAELTKLTNGGRFIAAGDWNIARLVDEGYPGTPGTEFFERLKARGWFDCVWEKRGEEMQTLFRSSARPYQDDHVFCDPDLGKRLTTVRVATEAATELGLSDHAPLIADFDIAPVSLTALEIQAD